MPARLARASCLADLLADATACLAGQGVPSPRLDAEVLLAHVMGGSRTELYLHDSLAPRQRDAFWHTLKRRARREPVAYITGVQEFWSLEFTVNRHVLIPRPETERVVEVGLELLDSYLTPRILDLGTGSGCIAVALASQLPQAQVWTCDVSVEALTVARTNAVAHGLAERMTFVQADMRHGLPQGVTPPFDLIVSNPPYVAGPEFATLQAEVRDWEPRLALDGGKDGLDFYHRLLQDCPVQLRPGGWLVMEVGSTQSESVMRMAKSQDNLSECRLSYDYAGLPRVVSVRRHSPVERRGGGDG
jgi:release factor glutamine methyltransferase